MAKISSIWEETAFHEDSIVCPNLPFWIYHDQSFVELALLFMELQEGDGLAEREMEFRDWKYKQLEGSVKPPDGALTRLKNWISARLRSS